MAEPGSIPVPPPGERGRDRDGNQVEVDRRLYMQLLVFRGRLDEERLRYAVEHADLEAVVYRDLYDPFGYGFLTMNEDPGYFVGELRSWLQDSPLAELEPVPRYSMFGRTYTLGHETDPTDALLKRPRERAFNPEWPWAVWYPLRRRGSFERLSEEEQRSVLSEHGRLGATFGKQGYGVDIRLACHGIDRDDNDFLLGLVGPSLHRLSLIVQTMRKTRHTSEFLERLGPFFVGKVLHRSVSR